MNINDLIKSRLQEIPSNVQTVNALPSKNGFSIPKLNLPVFGGMGSSPVNNHPLSLELSLQKIRNAGFEKSDGEDKLITEKLEELVLCPETKSIDLSSAINKADAVKPTQNRKSHKSKDNDTPIMHSNPSLVIEFCESDISNFRYGQFCCEEPSSFGKITCIRYRRYSAKRITIDHGFHPKHTITRFNFNTKSPDDIVISKNSKNKR